MNARQKHRALEWALVAATVGALALAWSGCATANRVVELGEDALARAVTAGYVALDRYDEQKVAAIKAQADAGDMPGAMLQLGDYGPKRQKAIAGLDAAADMVQAVDDARQTALAAKADPKAFFDWLPKMAKAAADLAAGLTAAGVKLPDAITGALGSLGVK